MERSWVSKRLTWAGGHWKCFPVTSWYAGLFEVKNARVAQHGTYSTTVKYMCHCTRCEALIGGYIQWGMCLVLLCFSTLLTSICSSWHWMLGLKSRHSYSQSKDGLNIWWMASSHHLARPDGISFMHEEVLSGLIPIPIMSGSFWDVFPRSYIVHLMQ